jgi:cytoskeletal protein CcmA (bactofilin family)
LPYTSDILAQMFGRASKPQSQQRPSKAFTYIQQGTTVKGNLTVKGKIRVVGEVFGNITVDGVLEVAESGRIEGEAIQADDVIIIGHVKANIDARGKIEIWKKGRLEGDVQAAALDIEEGASFTGRSEMRVSDGVPKLLAANEEN